MSQFLLLTLYAPLASWGEIAVGETRGSWDRPSRSAVLGLVAAALGLDRSDQAAHDALDTGYGFAVRLDTPGTPLVDYHTAQTVAESVLKKARPATRKAMLEAGDRETILSRRTYRVDALYTAALWANDAGRWPLGILRDAIRRPAFVLYAGRRANPFGLPLGPEVIDARTLADAFRARPARTAGELLDLEPDYRRKGTREWGCEVAFDLPRGSTASVEPGFPEMLRRETRRDSRPDRTRWQFAERTVAIARLPDVQEQSR